MKPQTIPQYNTLTQECICGKITNIQKNSIIKHAEGIQLGHVKFLDSTSEKGNKELIYQNF